MSDQSYHLYNCQVPQSQMDEWALRNSRYKAILKRTKGSDNVLVLGCSSGYGAQHFRFCVKVDAVDKDREPIEFATAEYGRFPALKFHWSRADTFMRQAPDRHYRAVVCMDMLHENHGKESDLIRDMLRVCQRAVFIGVRNTPQYSKRDVEAAVQRYRPNAHMQLLVDEGDFSIVMFTNI